jgi:hypothetical protein
MIHERTTVMIYLFDTLSVLIHGQIPEPVPEPIGDPVAQTTPSPIANPPLVSDDKMTVDRKYIEGLRKEAEQNRKSLETLKAQMAKAEEDKKLAEMSEIDRLKARTIELEKQYNTEKESRELEMKRSKLVNTASMLNVAIPEFAVNQISIETLRSLDLANNDVFIQEIQNVITQAENAGMPITRKAIQQAPGVVAPSPIVGATNPVNENYPKPILTTEQQVTSLKSNYLKAVTEGNISERQRIETEIRRIEDQLGGIRKPPG